MIHQWTRRPCIVRSWIHVTGCHVLGLLSIKGTSFDDTSLRSIDDTPWMNVPANIALDDMSLDDTSLDDISLDNGPWMVRPFLWNGPLNDYISEWWALVWYIPRWYVSGWIVPGMACAQNIQYVTGRYRVKRSSFVHSGMKRPWLCLLIIQVSEWYIIEW